MNEAIRKQMQEQNLAAIVRNKGFKFSQTFFPYTSGEIGPYYVNSECVMKNPQDYALAVKSIGDLVTEEMKNFPNFSIGGGESRDWIFSYPVSIRLGKPPISVYKDGRIIPGDAKIKGERFAWIADLNNEGSSPRDMWVPTMRKAGGILENIFFYVDRMEEGFHVMQELELNSQAVVPLDGNAWTYLQHQQVVSKEVYKNLMERGKTKQERDAWAIKMLRSDQGIETLGSLLIEDPKSIEKGRKIIFKGYPEMRAELLDRLNQYDHRAFVNAIPGAGPKD